MNSRFTLAILAVLGVFLSSIATASAQDAQPSPMSNLNVMNEVLGRTDMSDLRRGYGSQGFEPDPGMGSTCGKQSYGALGGSGGGGQSASTQAIQTAPTKQNPTFEATNDRKMIAPGPTGQSDTGTTGETTTLNPPQFIYLTQRKDNELKDPDPMTAALSDVNTGAQSSQGSTAWMDTSTPLSMLTSITGGGGCLPGGVCPANPGGGPDGASGDGVGDCSGGASKCGAPGCPPSGSQIAAGSAICAKAGAQQANDPQCAANGSCSNKGECGGAQASAAAEDALLNAFCAFDVFSMPLINVANENAASRTSSRAPTKSYGNVIYMVQQMYKSCYIPMAILFLLPGALITNTKTLISFGFLGGKDEDSASPFAGIMRAMIAIFLIPATQLAVSYLIDVGNSLQDCTKEYVSLPLILLWAHEQAQTFGPDQQGNLIKNMPVVQGAPYLGKFAGMPVAGAMLEQLGGMHIALAELCNEMMHMLSMGLCVISAFQLVMACYLFLMGPLAAAFFAWPSVGRDLFRKAFSTWLDGMVVLSLWKFWWTIVLCCMTARLEAGFINPFDPFEVYYFIAFMCILLVVPFNPFDFKAGELVSMVLMKAEGVAAKVAQGGKGGGSGAKPSGKSCG